MQQEYDERNPIASAFLNYSISFLIISVAVPAVVCYTMAKVKAADKLHTLPFTAGYGWLCKSYVQNCYGWELIALNGRMTMALSVIFDSHSSVLTLNMLILNCATAIRRKYPPRPGELRGPP